MDFIMPHFSPFMLTANHKPVTASSVLLKLPWRASHRGYTQDNILLSYLNQPPCIWTTHKEPRQNVNMWRTADESWLGYLHIVGAFGHHRLCLFSYNSTESAVKSCSLEALKWSVSTSGHNSSTAPHLGQKGNILQDFLPATPVHAGPGNPKACS